jgi:hypothetical protein
MNISEVWADILNFLGQAWWIEVVTIQPKCTYYFGPFIDAKDANIAIAGYIDDLESELAQGIQTLVKRHKPDRWRSWIPCGYIYSIQTKHAFA